MNNLAVRRPRTVAARMAAVAAFACLALATGCSGGATTPAGPAAAAPPVGSAPFLSATPDAAAPAAAPTDFCAGMKALALKTNAMTQGGSISPAQYTEIGDEMAALVPLAPAEAVAPLKTLADEYHKIGSGASTLDKSAAKVGDATIKLAGSGQKCVGS